MISPAIAPSMVVSLISHLFSRETLGVALAKPRGVDPSILSRTLIQKCQLLTSRFVFPDVLVRCSREPLRSLAKRRIAHHTRLFSTSQLVALVLLLVIATYR